MMNPITAMPCWTQGVSTTLQQAAHDTQERFSAWLGSVQQSLQQFGQFLVQVFHSFKALFLRQAPSAQLQVSESQTQEGTTNRDLSPILPGAKSAAAQIFLEPLRQSIALKSKAELLRAKSQLEAALDADTAKSIHNLLAVDLLEDEEFLSCLNPKNGEINRVVYFLVLAELLFSRQEFIWWGG